MPRNGDGSSDNAIENTNDIIHGSGEVKVRLRPCHTLTPQL